MSGQNRAHIVRHQTQAARLRYGQYQNHNKPSRERGETHEDRKPSASAARCTRTPTSSAPLRQPAPFFWTCFPCGQRQPVLLRLHGDGRTYQLSASGLQPAKRPAGDWRVVHPVLLFGHQRQMADKIRSGWIRFKGWRSASWRWPPGVLLGQRVPSRWLHLSRWVASDAVWPRQPATCPRCCPSAS